MKNKIEKVKERPIIFSSEMVRAILDGRKTQERRVVKGWYLNLVEEVLRVNGKWVEDTLEYELTSPFGRVGDRLFVKETWRVFGGREYEYQQDPKSLQFKATDEGHHTLDWRPSIHMPRWASRITLEITNIRVENLQDISEEDAKAEGCLPLVEEDGSVTCGRRKTVFTRLWNSLHKKDGFEWDKNHWVWVIEFKKIETGK